jgi:hypothetical protein
MNSRLEEKASAILLLSWDPIGISDEPRAHDEYESYVPEIVRLIRRGDTEDHIAWHLLGIERGRMGLPGQEAQARTAARRLVALRDDVD